MMLSSTRGRVRAMNHIAGAEDDLGDPASLWVSVDCLRQSQCFELDGHTRHCVVIGSSLDADLRVQGKLSTPIQCNLEREGDDVWLIPGWPTNHIRIDGVLIERPVKLWRRCSMEIEGIRMDVRIREEPPTSPDIELLATPQSGCGSARVSVREIIAIECDGLRERSSRASGTNGHSRADSSPKWLVAQPEQRAYWVQSRAGLGVEPFEEAPSSTGPTAVSMREVTLGSPHALARLGLLTRRRPWMVSIGALFGASAITSLLHVGSLLLEDRFMTERASVEHATPLSSLSPCAERSASSALEGAEGCGRIARQRLERIVTSIGRPESTGVITLAVTTAAAGAANSGARPDLYRSSRPQQRTGVSTTP